MQTGPVEVVVVEASAGPADLAARVAALLSRGIDVVVTGPLDLPGASDAPGRLVTAPADGDAAGWARRWLAGAGAPEGAVVVVHDGEDIDAILAAGTGALVSPVPEGSWRLDIDRADPAREREIESWLTVGNGRTGTRGSLEAPGPEAEPGFFVAGFFGQDPAGQAGPELVRGPEWTTLPVAAGTGARRTLDIRQGVLHSSGEGFRTARYASLADRQVHVLEAQGAPPGTVPAPEAKGSVEAVDAVATDRGIYLRLQGRDGRSVWFAISDDHDDAGRTTRLVAVDRDGPAHDALSRAEAQGPDELLARHRRAWRERWAGADVVVDGDPLAQRDLRFALYHLIIAGDPESDRASIGARSLSGPGYRGHVFWDTEIFLLPFYIWTHPETARALLAYRHRTLPAARAKAARLGYAGALYAWESADTGEETTPEFVYLPDGTRLTILTGVQEHHIAADVAWSVLQYWQVTGDDGFLEDMGAEIVVETARFWASRATPGEDGRRHICEVIGPDEYHEGVDDNAYTNVMARWNLRAAGALCDRLPDAAVRLGVTPAERAHWDDVAGGIAVLFDPATSLFEQFAGFFALENIRSVDLAPRPFTGEMVVGVDRLRRTQVVKQADVLMLGVLLPDEVDLATEAANYRYYEPRTSHGSSLSPAMHALVAARVGDLDDALAYFHLAGGVDLDNRMGNAADGVHIATMGGLWQAAGLGFGGVRADGDAVRIDPRVPSAWAGLTFPIRWRGTRITVTIHANSMELDLDGAALLAVGGGSATPLSAGRFVAGRAGGSWSLDGQA
jgi:trehalose/maltose hydrolase-like predicted phosphorylase